MHDSAGPHRVQKRALDALEPEVEVGGSLFTTEPILQSRGDIFDLL